jgi:hypothetical protein
MMCSCPIHESVEKFIFYCTQPPHTEMTKLLCPHHEGAGAPTSLLHIVIWDLAVLWYGGFSACTRIQPVLVSLLGVLLAWRCTYLAAMAVLLQVAEDAMIGLFLGNSPAS